MTGKSRLETGAPPQNLHEQIRSDIEEKIFSGTWPPGHRIPFEHELMEQYGCSRMTVNKAVSELVRTGLIERKRRAGSFVAKPRLHMAALEIPDIQLEVHRRGGAYRCDLLHSAVRAPAGHSDEERELASGGRLLDLHSVHFFDNQPFALEYRLLALSAVPEAAEMDFAVEAPGHWLLQHVPWTKAEHHIQAISPNKEQAEALEISTATACLAVSRKTWRIGEPITYVRQIFPGDLYELSAYFGPGQG